MESSQSALPSFKRCSSCRRNLPVAYFTKYRISKDNLSAYCRDCRTEVTRNFYQKKYGVKNPRIRKNSITNKNLNTQNGHILDLALAQDSFICKGFNILTKQTFDVKFELFGSDSVRIDFFTIRQTFVTNRNEPTFRKTLLTLLKNQDIRLEENEVTMHEALTTLYYI